MPIAIKMPALSPTMEEGTLAKWLVKVGDTVTAGDIMAEIETDKATMEFEAVDEGTVADIAVEEGSEGVAVGTVIMTLAEEGEDLDEVKAAAEDASGGVPAKAGTSGDSEPSNETPASAGDRQDKSTVRPEPVEGQEDKNSADAESSASTSSARTDDDKAKAPAAPSVDGERIIASPLARRIAEQNGVDLAAIEGSGPNGRIVKADLDRVPAKAGTSGDSAPPTKTPASAGAQQSNTGAPYEAQKLNNVRKVIARRLTEAKQTIPHIYLTVDVRLDALLDLRGALNASLEADGIKLSVNDLLIKALARALQRVPACNVSFQGDELYRYSREDISVAVAAPSGLITPIIVEAGRKGLAQISSEMKSLADKAREGKLQPHEYQGGTASLSNLGMFGTKQFDAVINPPQAMILAVGAGGPRPHVVDGTLQIATVMSATGSFDHRAIDGADGAQLMEAFKQLCENPMGLVV